MLGKKSGQMGMLHLNGNVLCSIDCETSGPSPQLGELLQIAVVPLDYTLDVWQNYKPFYMLLKPKNEAHYDDITTRRHRSLFRTAMVHGIDPFRASELFEEWFEAFNLGYQKKISPLAHNWVHDQQFIADWLGPKSFNDFFDSRYRDTMTIAHYFNDYQYTNVEPILFSRVGLSNLCSHFKLDNPDRHDALADAIFTAKVYKNFIEKFRLLI